jgi:hypothetical protein
LSSYVWSEAVNNGVELDNIGYTGIDNGLILFDKDNITEEELEEIKKNSILTLLEDDYRLRLTPVNGNNKIDGHNIYSYENEFITENNENVAKLNGGFYQGFFQTNNGCNYQVLPNKLNGGWTLEFILKPEDYENESGIPRLNDIYPENKGIFFYVGTRAENKWYKLYNDVDFVDDSDKDESKYTTTIETDNKFITYNRSKTGMRANWPGDKDRVDKIVFDNHKPLDNYFIIANRSKSGYTAKTIKELVSEEGYDYNVLADLFRNAFALQIKDDGRIGYKFMVKDCESETGYSIKEEWSYPGMVDKNVWSMITVRIVPAVKFGVEMFNYNSSMDYMRLLFYVNGKLVLFSKMIPTLLLRMLNDSAEKQEGVPYNISLGGGSQGLCDVIYGIDDMPEDHLFIEKEFGGSFIGLIKQFRFHSCDLNFQQVYHNYLYEIKKKNMGEKIYYGTLTFDGLSSDNPLTVEDILSLKKAAYNTKTLNIKLAVGIRRIVIAIPDRIDNFKEHGAVLDVNAMKLNIKDSFVNSILTKTMNLPIPNTPEMAKYNIYVIDYAFHNDCENNYIVNL